MSDETPRIVTPENARKTLDLITPEGAGDWFDLNYTVATEPDRIAQAERGGAVKALREAAEVFKADGFGTSELEARYCIERIAEIENGADL